MSTFSTFHVAPSAASASALCFMALDNDVSAAALCALKNLTFLHNVAKIQLQ